MEYIDIALKCKESNFNIFRVTNLSQITTEVLERERSRAWPKPCLITYFQCHFSLYIHVRFLNLKSIYIYSFIDIDSRDTHAHAACIMDIHYRSR